MGENQSPFKWEGKTSSELKGHAAEQVWPLLADFCNLHKRLPVLDTCHLVDGVPGQPGVIWYCAMPLPYPDDGTTTKWPKEKLLMIDPINYCLSYEINENNIGFKLYVATMQLVPINGEEGRTGSRIEWLFVSDPVEGWKYEDLQVVYETYLELITKNMKNALLSSSLRSLTSSLIDGVLGQPCVIRYCAPSLPSSDDGTTIKWAKEKLLMIDPINHYLSYEINENNIGFMPYIATMQLVPINSEDGRTGCIIEWSFVCDPVEGGKYEDLQAVYETYLELKANGVF